MTDPMDAVFKEAHRRVPLPVYPDARPMPMATTPPAAIIVEHPAPEAFHWFSLWLVWRFVA